MTERVIKRAPLVVAHCVVGVIENFDEGHAGRRDVYGVITGVTAPTLPVAATPWSDTEA